MKYFFLSTFLITFLGIKAQYYVSGQDRGSIKWKQIETNNFRIIYPDYSDSIAQSFANSMNWVYLNSTQDMKHKPKKFDILFHTESAISNGMVVWAPKRMEIYSTFPQSTFAQNWMEQLATHEFRHIVQVDKLNQGFTKTLSFALGQQAIGAVLGLYIPTWFLEGDAVWAETVFTSSGRGRENTFSEPLKAQILSKGIYSYDKAVMGSYRNFVPNEYVLGYNFVAQVKSEFGDEIFSKALDNVAKKPFTVVPFSRSLKKNTGFNKVKLYKHSMNILDSVWNKQTSNYPPLQQENIYNPVSKSFTDYVMPHLVSDSLLFVIKSGIDDIPRFVKININTKKETVVLTPGFSNFYHVIFTKNLIIWSQLDYDPRWTHRKYWNLYEYDFNSKKIKQLTKNKICFSPELNSDGSKVLFVETDMKNNFFIKVIDLIKGNELISYKLDEYPITPVFGEDEKDIYFVRLYDKKGQSIAKINIESGEITDIIQPNYFTKSSINLSGDFLYYQCAYDGVNNVYAKNLKENKIFQISNLPMSLVDMSVEESGNLLYSYYTADGYRVAMLDKQYFTWKPLEKITNNYSEIFKIDNSKTFPNIQKDSSKYAPLESKKYSKIGHLLNIHSWFPAQFDIGNLQLNPAIKLLSQNLLGTAETSAGYTYYRNSGGEKYYLDFSYKGFYPVIGGGIKYLKTPILDSLGQKTTISRKDLLTYLYIYQPINFSKGKYYRYFEPNITANLQMTSKAKGLYFFPINFGFYIHNIIHSGSRDLRPKWGQSLELNYFISPISGLLHPSYRGNQITVSSILYFPGIINHHSFRIYIANQNVSSNQLNYTDKISLPRGFVGIIAMNYFSSKFDYAFPIIYPDLSISSLTYIKRIKANIFYDYGYGNKLNYHSYGIDLTADVHFLRFIAPVEIGLRTTYAAEINSLQYELLFGVDFNSL